MNMWYIYTVEFYIAVKNEATVHFAATWRELEDSMLNEVRKREKDK